MIFGKVNAQNNNGVSVNNNPNANANANATGNTTIVTGNPAVFGNNIWNVYVYDGNEISAPATAVYAGYYTENNLNFDSRKRYPYSNGNNALPSNSNANTGKGYVGMSVGTVHTVDYKREGFEEGFYQIDIPTLDDKGYLAINGITVWSFNGCCESHLGVWKGFLNASSTVELKYVNFASGSAAAITMKIYENTALPVSFAGLMVTKNGSTANIEWSTASEHNNNFFTVEKSTDGISFEMIITVKGAGNSNQITEYNTIDNKLSFGTSYYRIKQTDVNNNSTYSAIISINNTNNAEVTVYPNPANENEEINVVLAGMNDAQITISIRDLQGMEYFSQTVTGETPLIAINNNMAPGMYIVAVSSENNSYSQKIIVR